MTMDEYYKKSINGLKYTYFAKRLDILFLNKFDEGLKLIHFIMERI